MQISAAICNERSTMSRAPSSVAAIKALRRRLRITAAGADGDQLVLGFDHIAVA
jgi:hypothetical protein